MLARETNNIYPIHEMLPSPLCNNFPTTKNTTLSNGYYFRFAILLPTYKYLPTCRNFLMFWMKILIFISWIFLTINQLPGYPFFTLFSRIRIFDQKFYTFLLKYCQIAPYPHSLDTLMLNYVCRIKMCAECFGAKASNLIILSFDT